MPLYPYSLAIVPLEAEEAAADEDPEYDPEEVFPDDMSSEGMHFLYVYAFFYLCFQFLYLLVLSHLSPF